MSRRFANLREGDDIDNERIVPQGLNSNLREGDVHALDRLLSEGFRAHAHLLHVIFRLQLQNTD